MQTSKLTICGLMMVSLISATSCSKQSLDKSEPYVETVIELSPFPVLCKMFLKDVVWPQVREIAANQTPSPKISLVDDVTNKYKIGIDLGEANAIPGPGAFYEKNGRFRLKNSSGSALLRIRKGGNSQTQFKNVMFECDIELNGYYPHESNGIALGVRGEPKQGQGLSFEWVANVGAMKINRFGEGDANKIIKSSTEPPIIDSPSGNYHMFIMIKENTVNGALINSSTGEGYYLEDVNIPPGKIHEEGGLYLHTWMLDATFSNIRIAELP